ncbi:hypothetical protein SeMB42_g05882, partial [Synchytrium endobioticum]
MIAKIDMEGHGRVSRRCNRVGAGNTSTRSSTARNSHTIHTRTPAASLSTIASPKMIALSHQLPVIRVRIADTNHRWSAYSRPSSPDDAWEAYLQLRNDPEMQGLLSKSALSSVLKWALNHALCIPLPELAFERAITVMQDIGRHKVELQRDDWAIFLSSLQGWQKLDTVFTQLIPSW